MVEKFVVLALISLAAFCFTLLGVNLIALIAEVRAERAEKYANSVAAPAYRMRSRRVYGWTSDREVEAAPEGATKVQHALQLVRDCGATPRDLSMQTGLTEAQVEECLMFWERLKKPRVRAIGKGTSDEADQLLFVWNDACVIQRGRGRFGR